MIQGTPLLSSNNQYCFFYITDGQHAQNAFIFCRTCCITSSQKDSLIADQLNYYTTLGDTSSAYQTVTSAEQIALDKIPGPKPPKTTVTDYEQRKDL